ncbi:hypothetical protein U1Q18_050521 [Sarracenia purpurea var. burkii]
MVNAAKENLPRAARLFSYSMPTEQLVANLRGFQKLPRSVILSMGTSDLRMKTPVEVFRTQFCDFIRRLQNRGVTDIITVPPMIYRGQIQLRSAYIEAMMEEALPDHFRDCRYMFLLELNGRGGQKTAKQLPIPYQPSERKGRVYPSIRVSDERKN